MIRTLPRCLVGLMLVVGLSWPSVAADPIAPAKAETKADLSEFKTVEKAITTTLKKTAPAAQGQSGYLGVHVTLNPQGQLMVADVSLDSPAAKAGLQKEDVILKVAGKEVKNTDVFRELLLAHRPGEEVKLNIVRQAAPHEITAKLGATSRPMRNTDEIWKKPVYKLAVLCVEFPDVKHNAKITPEDWNEALFSRDKYKNKENVTGQPVYGSLADYFGEMSCGALKVQGKVFDWVEVKKNRMDYAPGSGTGAKGPFLTELLELVQKRDGKDALKDFDGLFFVYAGEPPGRLNRGHLYAPHRSTVRADGKTWSYFLCSEGGARLTNLSLICHEFGLLLGLPELSARQENAGSKGAGAWCLMSNQADSNRPQHLCAWSKEQFGWIKPTVIDPTVRQKLILSPIEGNTKECYKVLLKLDGSEYLLLENRQKKGYDESLPGEGLLIWRVVHNKPILEESHGIEGPAGPRSFLSAIPYPSSANDSFTPYTTPSSRAQLGGGLPVYLTNIRRLPDGRITFHIGYQYQ